MYTYVCMYVYMYAYIGSHFVGQATFKLRDLTPSTSQMLGSKVCDKTTQLYICLDELTMLS